MKSVIAGIASLNIDSKALADCGVCVVMADWFIRFDIILPLDDTNPWMPYLISLQLCFCIFLDLDFDLDFLDVHDVSIFVDVQYSIYLELCQQNSENKKPAEAGFGKSL